MGLWRGIAGLGCGCLFLAALVAPRPALALTGQPAAASSMSCAGQIVVSAPTSASGNGQTINSAADVQCAVPIVTGPVSPPSVSRAVETQPAIGTACHLVSWQPLTLKAYGADPRTGFLNYGASWVQPDGFETGEGGFGLPGPDTPVTWQPPGPQGNVTQSAEYQAMYDLQVKYDGDGVWTANGCELAPGKKWVECRVLNVIYRGSSMDASACTRAIFRGPVAPSQPPGYGLANFDYRQYVQNHVVAGNVMSVPKANRGLVRIPTYFWIDGMTIDGQAVNGTQAPQPQTRVIRVATPPDGAGRSIVYQYVITVGLSRIVWNFGDGSGTEDRPIPNGVGQPYPAQSTVSHTYTTISATGCGRGACGGAGDRYHVTANAVYQVTVNALWFDGANTHTQAVPLANNGQIELPVNPADLYVGQAEGVPVTS